MVELAMEADAPLEATQETQPASQALQQTAHMNAHLWGSLIPCSNVLNRIDFWRGKHTYEFGRHPESDIQLPGAKISNRHCRVTWRAQASGSEVVVEDLSTNGTFINGTRIGKGNTMLLKQGHELALGHSAAQPPADDFRFLYRHLGDGPAETGGIFEHYGLSAELGKGSFASVRKAIRISDGREFAVKIINRAKFALNQNVQRMFEREMDILKGLDHPNIVRWIETFADDQTIWLVMEYVNGGDLLECILGTPNQTGMPEQDAKHITRQICAAMAYIHAQGITHRDLKPENVLITRDEPRVAKVADFGLAKAVDSGTWLRTMCGTPSYLAPEVVLQTEKDGYSNKVDSWSVGVIVFSMLTAMAPFNEDENVPLQQRMRVRMPDWGTLRERNVSYEAEDFVRQLLDNDARTRMSLGGALQHPWLAETRFSQLSSAPPSEIAMADSQGFEHVGLPLRGVPGADSSSFLYGEAMSVAHAGPGPGAVDGAGAGVGDSWAVVGGSQPHEEETIHPTGGTALKRKTRSMDVDESADGDADADGRLVDGAGAGDDEDAGEAEGSRDAEMAVSPPRRSARRGKAPRMS